MKKLIIAVALAAGLITGGLRLYSGLYVTAGEVVNVDLDRDFVVVSIAPRRETLYNSAGQPCGVAVMHETCFSFYGADGWKEGDAAALIMFDCLSSSIYDDMILKANNIGRI